MQTQLAAGAPVVPQTPEHVWRAPPRRRYDDQQRFAALMRAAQSGDRTAYATLMHELPSVLRRLMGRRLGLMQASDREDLLQDILLSVHTAKAAYDPSRPFLPWLMCIAHNRTIDRARRNGKLWTNEILVDEFSETLQLPASEQDEDYGDAEALHQAVRMLPARQRIAIELVKLRELSLKQAADLSGISTTALKVLVHRAVKRLRCSLAQSRPSARPGVASSQRHWKGGFRPDRLQFEAVA